jgi:hypothetical protein
MSSSEVLSAMWAPTPKTRIITGTMRLLVPNRSPPPGTTTRPRDRAAVHPNYTTRTEVSQILTAVDALG